MSDPEASQASESSEANLSFEQAFERLESVVDEMENGQIPLESLIEDYEVGTRLFRVCQKRLEEAQGRIEMIRNKVDGEVEVEPFEPDSTAAAAVETEISKNKPAKAAKPSLKEDAELF